MIRTILFGILLHPFCAFADDDPLRWIAAEQALIQTSMIQRTFFDSLCLQNNVNPSYSIRTLTAPPFWRGEELVYEATWGPFQAGIGTVTIRPDYTSSLIVVDAMAMTNDFVSAFYKVRDGVRSYITATGIYPLFMEQHLREGKYSADRWQLFDHVRAIAHTYDNKHPQTVIVPGAQDYISIIPYLRQITIMPGDTFSIPLYSHPEMQWVLFRCRERTTVTIGSQKYNCIVVAPLLFGKGRIFSKRDELLLYLTDDNLHMPVLVKTKVRIGTLELKLLRVTRF